MREDDSVLTIDPARQFGQVCINATRVPASAVAGCVAAGDDVDNVAEDYGCTREQVLVACWWYANNQTGRGKWARRIRAGWGEWALDAAMKLGGHREGEIPDPPSLREDDDG